jgi:hypothetical protein
MSQLTLNEAAAPGTPSTGKVTVYAKSDGFTYQKDDAGVETCFIRELHRPNLLINPNWQIDQINEGALYTINAGVQGPDGWGGSVTGAGVFKLRTLVDPDNTALKCLEITCTTADALMAASDYYGISTLIEGYDAAALMAGTSSALPITIQFKFKTNVTGVYGVAIRNSAANRSYVGIITVADTAENEYSVTLTMDTAGTWLYTNGVGLILNLTLAAGTDANATAGSWQAGGFRTTSAQCNFMSSTSNIAYLKRIQLIPGSVVQAYKPADIQRELAKCQRYYAKTFAQGTAPAQSAGVVGTVNSLAEVANSSSRDWRFPCTMRASPTIVSYNPSAANANVRDITNGADRTITVNAGSQLSPDVVNFQFQAVSAPCNNAIHFTANARLS